MKKNIFKIPFLVIFLCSIVLAEEESLVEKQCNRIGNKLGSVSVADCLAIGLTLTDGITFEGAPILIKEYTATRNTRTTRKSFADRRNSW